MDVDVIIPLVVAFVCVGAASYTDIKKREIPNSLPYIMIAFGVGFNAVIGGLAGDITIPLSSMAAALMAFAIGLLFWKMGAWAGGDAKFFAGLAAILPSLGFLRFPLFPFALLIISMSAFIVYTFLHTVYHMARGVNTTMRRMKVDRLEEGMVPGEYIYRSGMGVHRSPSGRGHQCPQFTEVYADPRGMEGLTKEQIAKLKEVLGGEDTIYVRRTHAFVPFFLVGLVVVMLLVM